MSYLPDESGRPWTLSLSETRHFGPCQFKICCVSGWMGRVETRRVSLVSFKYITHPRQKRLHMDFLFAADK